MITLRPSNCGFSLTKAAGSPLLLYETLGEQGVGGVAAPPPLQHLRLL
ncbi:hypothetical protein [Nostoc sp. NZL]|nr:hypothetical protein [Nostoc sp. NZL]